MAFMDDFIKKNRITEVECLVPDQSGIARGKIVPAEKFLRILRDRGLRLPEAIFVQTVTGEYPEDEDVIQDGKSDAFGINEGSADAMGILQLVNTASAETLRNDVKITSQATRWILAHRAGPMRSAQRPTMICSTVWSSSITCPSSARSRSASYSRSLARTDMSRAPVVRRVRGRSPRSMRQRTSRVIDTHRWQSIRRAPFV